MEKTLREQTDMSWEDFLLGEFENQTLSPMGQRVGKWVHIEHGVKRIIKEMESTSSSVISRSSRHKNHDNSLGASTSGSDQAKGKKKVRFF